MYSFLASRYSVRLTALSHNSILYLSDVGIDQYVYSLLYCWYKCRYVLLNINVRCNICLYSFQFKHDGYEKTSFIIPVTPRKTKKVAGRIPHKWCVASANYSTVNSLHCLQNVDRKIIGPFIANHPIADIDIGDRKDIFVRSVAVLFFHLIPDNIGHCAMTV